MPAAAADEARVLAPSGDWTLTSDTESCSISRQFGSAEDGVLFRVQVFSPGRGYRVLLWGKPLPQRDSGALDFTYSFEPDPGTIPTTGVLGKSNNIPVVMFRTSFDTSAMASARSEGNDPEREAVERRAAAIEGFTIAFSRGRPLSLPLGPMADHLRRLTACAAELPAKWGLDLATQQSLSRWATPIDQEAWLAPGTYPWTYLRNSQSLMVYLRMLVDASGAPTECVVQAPRTSSGADALACREIMKSARFDPALDREGKPVASYYTTSVFFYTKRWNGPINRGGTVGRTD
jgi:hypothetical protein